MKRVHSHYKVFTGHVSVDKGSPHYRAGSFTKDLHIYVDGVAYPRGVLEAKSGKDGYIFVHKYDDRGWPVKKEGTDDLLVERVAGNVEIRQNVGDLSLHFNPRVHGAWVPYKY